MYFTGFLFLSLWLVSCRGKALKSMENRATDVLRTTDGTTDGIEQGRDITQREVTAIKSRFEQQRYHKRKGDEHLPNKIPILEGSKRSCFCPFSASCPDGFVRTYPQWPAWQVQRLQMVFRRHYTVLEMDHLDCKEALVVMKQDLILIHVHVGNVDGAVSSSCF